MKKGVFLLSLFLIMPAGVLFAGQPQIISMAVNPPSPDYGQRITVTVVYCGDKTTAHKIGIAVSTNSSPLDAETPGTGQVFIVSAAGMNRHTSVPASFTDPEIGWTASAIPGGGAPVNCMTCGSSSNDGTRITVVYGDDEYLTVPLRENFPYNCANPALYMHAVMRDTSITGAIYDAQEPCQKRTVNWNVPVPPQSVSIHKRMQGVVAAANDLLLVSIDYKYSDGQAVVDDRIPAITGASFNMVSHSITGTYSGPANGAVTAGQGLTWTLANRSGLKGTESGTIWYLLRVIGTPSAGAVITGAASAQLGSFSDSSAASIAVNKPSFMVKKTAHTSGVMQGDTMTYYIEYSIQGFKLAAFQPFDDLLTSNYTSTPPPWWQFMPGVSNGTWVIENSCVAGDKYIYGDTTANNDYPALIYTGYQMTNDSTCMGYVVSDVMIEHNGSETADGMVIIRTDGGVSAKTYALLLSIDQNAGACSGYAGFMKISGGSPSFPACSSAMRIDGNKWYRVKIRTGPGNACKFSAKIWLRSDPEPDSWLLSWTDTACAASGMDCATSGNTWYAGIGEQGGEYALTRDYYDNFMVFRESTASDAVIFDSIPAGMNFIGQQGPYPMTVSPGQVVGWGLSSTMEGNGVFTWWGSVTSCGTDITNYAGIDGSDPVIPNRSNRAVIGVTCPPTKTYTPTISPTHSITPTLDIFASPTSTPTVTPTNTPYPSFGNLNFVFQQTGTTSACANGNYSNLTFWIYNYGPGTVDTGNLSVKFWFHSSFNPAVSQYGTNLGPTYVGISNPAYSVTDVYPCSVPGEMANKYVKFSLGSYTLASGSYLQWIGAFNHPTYLTFDPECNDYSVIITPPFLGNLKNITLYFNDVLVWEALDSGGTLDPDSGVEPCGGNFFSPTPYHSPTMTFTVTSTLTATGTVTGTGTETASPTYTSTPTSTGTFTATPSETVSPTTTVSPTISPTADVFIFKTCDPDDYNGVWSGSNALITGSTLPAAVTQGSGCVKAYINSLAAPNDQVLVCSGFGPDVWGGMERLTADVYIDPASVPWSFYSIKHEVVLYVNGTYRLSAAVELNPGMNHVSFMIDYGLSGGLPENAVLSSFSLVLDLDPTCLKTGAVYVDNMQLWQGEPTATATFTSVVSATPTITPDISLAEAVDNMSLIWNSGGDTLWTSQTAFSYSGGDAAVSGPVAEVQKSVLQTYAGGTAHISFYWKVDSRDGDALKFLIDGIEQSSISGVVDWRPEEFDLTDGPHILTWEYEKNSDGQVSGADCGWVDFVGYYITTPTITPTYSVTRTWTVSPTMTVTPTAPPGSIPTATRTPVEPAAGDVFVYPQPATGGVTFAYRLLSPAEVRIRIYNFSGKLAGEISDTYISGTNRKYFDASGLPSGVYYYFIEEIRGNERKMQKLKNLIIAR